MPRKPKQKKPAQMGKIVMFGCLNYDGEIPVCRLFTLYNQTKHQWRILIADWREWLGGGGYGGSWFLVEAK